jgi:hypothetical protein
MVAVLAQQLSGLSLSRAGATTATATSAEVSDDSSPDDVWVVGDSITARSRARLRDRLRRSVDRAVFIDGVGGRNVSTLDELRLVGDAVDACTGAQDAPLSRAGAAR